MKCKELMINDWVSDKYGYLMQITVVGDGCASFEDDEGNLCQLDDKCNQPEPIPLTYEILKKNGWKDAEFWCEYQEGNNSIQACLPDMRGRINGIEIEHFKCECVHQYQHLLRLCGLDELADNFKI